MLRDKGSSDALSSALTAPWAPHKQFLESYCLVSPLGSLDKLHILGEE